MRKFLIIRFIKAVFTLFFIVSLVFIFTRLTGDPTEWLLPDDVSDVVRNDLRESLGLNKPVLDQYVIFFKDLFHGDMGKSFYYLRPVDELFRERAPATLKLGISSLILSILVGIPLGIFAATKRNTIVDRVAMTFSIAGNTIPNFILGIMMIFVFSLLMRGFLPSGGYGGFKYYILPVIALSMKPMSTIARLTRSSMLDVLKQDYLDCARAKGLSEFIVIYKHGLRNALVPVITIIGLQMGLLLGGSVVVETVFAWPGIGSLIVSSATKRDFPVLQFGVMMIAMAVIVTNTLVDISYALLDPRIRDNF